MKLRRSILLALGLTAAAASAAAHEFGMAVVAPFTVEAEFGEGVLDGLLFAASERDGHPGQTSDGHLGGVDVHFFPVDSAGGLRATIAELMRIDAPVVYLAAPADWHAALADALPAAVFALGRQPAATDPAVGEVSARFEAATGRPMSASARIGYNAGRRIDLAVRLLDGTEPRDALRRSLRQSAGGMDWDADF